MKKVRIVRLGPSAHSSEVIVSLKTVEGESEQLIVDSGSLDGDLLRVAHIGKTEKGSLVELPRETTRGQWRVWVPAESLA